MTSPSVPIPQPPTRPVVGNLPDIDSSKGILGIVELAERYGPIVRIQFFNRSIVAISSQQLVNEVCDESRFGKVLGVALREVREFAGDGLFTAETRGTQLAKGTPDPDAGVRAGGAEADVRRHGRHRRAAAAQVGEARAPRPGSTFRTTPPA